MTDIEGEFDMLESSNHISHDSILDALNSGISIGGREASQKFFQVARLVQPNLGWKNGQTVWGDKKSM